MKSYTFTLNSTQTPQTPELVNGYMFLDPVYGYSYTYPVSDIGGGFTGTEVYTQSANAGLFYPWGYNKQTIITKLSAGPFKGPYTISFSPAGLDTSVYALLKLYYDFGDGTGFSTDNSIVYSVEGTGGNGLSDPTTQIVTHDYWPTNSGVTTYTPTISVLNGDLSLNIFNISFDMVPVSIFEFDDINIINAAQHINSIEETLGVFELEGINTVTNARYFSAGVTNYNTTTNTILADFNDIPGLILNLDADDSLTITKDSNNLVTQWSDKSPMHNDFLQSDYVSAPTFLYRSQSKSQRKAVHFTSLSAATLATYLSCSNSTGFNGMSGGYTAFFIAALTRDTGTLFYGGSSSNFGTNLAVTVQPAASFTTYQGNTGIFVPVISYDLPAYSLYTVTADTSGNMHLTYDIQSYIFAGLSTQFGALTSIATISRPYNTSSLPSLLDAEISQILIYSGKLSDSDYTAVYNTLVDKWSLTLQSA